MLNTKTAVATISGTESRFGLLGMGQFWGQVERLPLIWIMLRGRRCPAQPAPRCPLAAGGLILPPRPPANAPTGCWDG